MDKDFDEWLKQKGIVPQQRDPSHNFNSVGFCEAEQKWYGWSHRGIASFGIGSTVKKGDCAYVASTPEELIDDHAEFFADISEESARQHREECEILPDRSGIRICPRKIVLPVVNTMSSLVQALEDEAIALPTTELFEQCYEVKCGRGEWTAQTLEDAYQMACDYAEGVA